MSNELQQDRVVEAGDPYTRTHWENNKTPLNAANLNNIENGIEQNAKAIVKETNERTLADIAINTELDAVEKKTGLIYPTRDKEGNVQNKASFDLANCFVASDLNKYPELIEISQQLSGDKDPSLLAMLLNEIYRRVKANEKLGVTTTVDLDNITGSASFNETFKEIIFEANNSDTFLSQFLNTDEATLGHIICIILVRMYSSLSKCGIYLDTSDEAVGAAFTYNINEIKTMIKRNDNTDEVWNRYSDVLDSLNSFNIMQLFGALLREVYYVNKQSLNRDNNLETLINDINGDIAATSVNKKITDAFNAFATNLSNDNIVNTYKELIDYVAEHGGEFAELVGLVDSIEKNYATKEELDEVASKVSENIDISNLISYGTEDPDNSTTSDYYVKLDDSEVEVKGEEIGTVVLNVGGKTSEANYAREGHFVLVSGNVPDIHDSVLDGSTYTDNISVYHEDGVTPFYKPAFNVNLIIRDTGAYSAVYNASSLIKPISSIPDNGHFSFTFYTSEESII